MAAIDPMSTVLSLLARVELEAKLTELGGLLADVMESMVRVAIDHGTTVEVVWLLTTPATLEIKLAQKGVRGVSLQLIAMVFDRLKVRFLRERACCTECAEPLTEEEIGWKEGLCISCRRWENLPVFVVKL